MKSKKNGIQNGIRRLESLSDKEKALLTNKELEKLYKNHPLTEDTTCGVGCLQGSWLQRFGNEKSYVVIYGILGSIFSAAFSYFNGTISTIEKRFKVPSRVTGLLIVGNDISSLIVGLFLSYYAGKKHRPRWMGIGMYSLALYCLLTALPHFIYGPGEEALALTLEYGSDTATDLNQTAPVDKKSTLCHREEVVTNDCKNDQLTINVPVVIFFIANFISGIGGALHHTIGTSYMDDNIEKHKIPFLISLSHFLRLLGPAVGYSLASLSLEHYISPTLTPKIGNKDPRWLGAWWTGWLLLAAIAFVLSSLIGLFPKVLPKAAVREMVRKEKLRLAGEDPEHEEVGPSIADMMASFKRLIKNKAYVFTNASHILFLFGYMPYWIYMPKYIETQYHKTASQSSLITGTVGLVFSALGILISGIVVSKFKPRARTLAAWNATVVALTAFGLGSYAFLGCDTSHSYGNISANGLLDTNLSCNSDCHCQWNRYTPVCSPLQDISYVTPCHAGCTGKAYMNGTKIYTDCSCVPLQTEDSFINMTYTGKETGGYVLEGPCPIDCARKFMIFVVILCTLKFVGSSSRASNFLISIRCVEPRDKSFSMGISMAVVCVLAFVPSPVFFGYILDKTCTMWGRTCSGTGNCWVYNGEKMRNLLNFTAASAVMLGALVDVLVWYYVKDVKIFDEEPAKKEKQDPTEEELIVEMEPTKEGLIVES